MKSLRFLLLIGCFLILTACKPPSTPAPPTEKGANLPVDQQQDDPDEDPPWPWGAIVVSSSADVGPNTFRKALESAQENDLIVFDPAFFPPHEPATIYVKNDALPGIVAKNLTIDASNAGVILDGSQLQGDWMMGLQLIDTEGIIIMGLQITSFNGPGIGINNTHDCVIGGDRETGDGPWGQGNLLTENSIGIQIHGPSSSNNTITGNLIGTDLSESDWLGNEGFGVEIIDLAQHNTVGPENVIANNQEFGVYVDPDLADLNTVEGNQIYDNAIGRGIPSYPAIFDFELESGTVIGATCPYCKVEFFSTTWYEGEIYEGEVTADGSGVFAYEKGSAFAGPMLTARTTSIHGKVSGFIWPPSESTSQTLMVQNGNTNERTQFFISLPDDIQDNHIATQYDAIDYGEDLTDFGIYRQGVTRARVSTNGIEPETDKRDNPEMPLSQAQQDHFNRMAYEDIIVTYILIFYDKENHPNGDGLPVYRFQRGEDPQAWLEYVRYMADALHDRVEYFEIWNEPDIPNYWPKSIYLADYLDLIRITVPVIRENAPEAKIIVGGVSGTAYDGAYNYLLGVLNSDVMPMVDVIGWHPMYNFTPDIPRFRQYYYDYPNRIQEIKDTAAANGFTGEFHATELSFRTEVDLGDEFYTLSQVGANKYFLQSALMHRGEDISIGLGSGYFVIRRLSTMMAGMEPVDFARDIETYADNLMNYSFDDANGNLILALWSHTDIEEFDPGIESTITIPNVDVSRVVAIDLLYNLEQELVFSVDNGELKIENLLIKDYPLLIRIEP
jgi:hypothetical protein